jgi:hypothetical protein
MWGITLILILNACRNTYWYRCAYLLSNPLKTYCTRTRHFLDIPEHIYTPITPTLRSIKLTPATILHILSNICVMSKGGVRDAWDDDWESLADVREPYA